MPCGQLSRFGFTKLSGLPQQQCGWRACPSSDWTSRYCRHVGDVELVSCIRKFLWFSDFARSYPDILMEEITFRFFLTNFTLESWSCKAFASSSYGVLILGEWSCEQKWIWDLVCHHTDLYICIHFDFTSEITQSKMWVCL